MLARKYDNYAWQEQPAEQYEAPQPVRRRRRKPDKMKLIRSGLFKIMAVVMVAYFAMVLRSDELVSLQKQEAQLINQNNELRIEVEQLKGPERIIGLAEQRLGMSVARSNIYVKAGEAAKSSNSLAAK